MVLLDYQPPAPPEKPQRLLPVLRFGAGSAGMYFVLMGLATGISHGKFDPCAPIMGCLIMCPIWMVLLGFGVSIRERLAGKRMGERNIAVSLLSGAGLVVAYAGAVTIVDGLIHNSRIEGFAAFVAFFMSPIGSAWIVFRQSKFDGD